jgi:hypothetical protein
MEPTGDQEHEESRRRLLEEGARSYLDAVSALIAYRQEVQNVCRTVLENHLDDYASALGLKVRLETSEIKKEEWPSFAEWGDLWILGVKVVREPITSTIRWWKTACCLEYEPGDAGLYCFIGEELPAIQMATKLFRTFHTLNKKVKHERHELWLPHSLTVEEVRNLKTNLEGVVQEWIELWKEVGGIARVFGE